MNAMRAQLILAIRDPGLRSLLAARLGMAGEVPISTVDHLAPALGKKIRATALLIIEESMIDAPPAEWVQTLRDQCWKGRIIIISRTAERLAETDDTVTIRYSDAGVAIPALVQLWQAEHGKPLNSSE
ncbi:hypothetical protein WSK_2736 [Novosphingobium sp. Rr 2-17]|uniref:hypothetical protein n=1 Tax=Novosphingobium sp. Rr 2-17 TaxID=555793 RepID=UPI0002699206|nr:hypothetical protein [Novosphingobium sp. Rr 2-17]EIZ78688.1 hypothetical protein WSK_2736 [Novosphingobium sp. Rr 2-17]